jgi:hypothetical protein
MEVHLTSKFTVYGTGPQPAVASVAAVAVVAAPIAAAATAAAGGPVAVRKLKAQQQQQTDNRSHIATPLGVRTSRFAGE